MADTDLHGDESAMPVHMDVAKALFDEHVRVQGMDPEQAEAAWMIEESVRHYWLHLAAAAIDHMAHKGAERRGMTNTFVLIRIFDDEMATALAYAQEFDAAAIYGDQYLEHVDSKAFLIVLEYDPFGNVVLT